MAVSWLALASTWPSPGAAANGEPSNAAPLTAFQFPASYSCGRTGGLSTHYGARRGFATPCLAATTTPSSEMPAPQELSFQKKYLKDAMRNAILIGGTGGVVAFSWWFTGKWWKLPLLFALPSMLYRLWATRMDTEKLAAMSASVDSKYVASTEEQQRELHSFMCSECGYTLFPARGREAAFFTDSFKCPMCQAPKSAFFDMSDTDEPAAKDKTPAAEQEVTSEDAK